jgi:predicted RND superfamily exporter protein
VLKHFGIIADWIVDHRRTTFALIAAWTALMTIGHVNPHLIRSWFPAAEVTESASDQTSETRQLDREQGFTAAPQRQPPDVSPVQVSGGDVILVAESDAFFTPSGAQAIRSVVSEIESLPQVTSVMWMERAPPLNLFGLPEPIFPKSDSPQGRFDAAKEAALAHPLVAGQLLSRDAKTMLLMVNLDWLFVMQDADCNDTLRDTAQRTAEKLGHDEMKFSVTGSVPIRLSRATSNRENEKKYQAIGYSIALLIAFVLFRGLSSVIIVALAPTFGVFWTLGLLHLLGYDDNPFNSVIVPVLLCMVGFTDGVHMMVQIRKNRASGMSSRDAARQSIREVGLACWLTSLTTAIGFGSLSLAHHEIVREFGYCCTIGVLMTFISVITIIPLACATRLGKNVHHGYGKNLVDQNLSKISVLIDYVLRHAKTISVIAVAVTVVLAAFTLKLNPDERLTSSLEAGSETARALAHLDQAFGGMETAQVEIRWHVDVPENDSEIGEVISEVHEILLGEEMIGNPISLENLVQALPGQGLLQDRMSMVELLPPPLKRAYYAPESRFSRVGFRIQDLGIASYGPVFERIENRLRAIESEHPNFRIQIAGNAIWRWQNLYQIVVDLAFSLGTASLIIFGVLTIVYRSIRLGLISVIPNLFPLASTGFLLWAVGQNLEIVSVCAFTVCLGIAVDDTIHFLTRYREEQKHSDDPYEVIRKAFIGVGTALIMTTVVLVIGFSTALLSDSRDHRIFAMMGILTISTALLGDLLFLPALLLRFAPKRSNNH